jgi:predicted RNA-binding Zn ribbon-like protein
MSTYAGPLRSEPLAIELHNTLYADRGEPYDVLSDAAGLAGWLDALADRLPVDPGMVEHDSLGDFVELRTAVCDALHAALDRGGVSDQALAVLNRFSAGSPESLELAQRGRTRESRIRYHAASPADVVLGAIASSAIALVSGPFAGDLRACGAPGCVLMFIKDHPRREWCCTTCGNRARQARHYARKHGRGAIEHQEGTGRLPRPDN